MKFLRPFSLLVAVAVVACAAASLTVVDLSPRVESDFFFSTDDPELQASQQIERLFPSGEQLLVSALAPDVESPDYVERVRALTEDLAAIEGIDSVQSITRGPSSPGVVKESPLWSRLLLGEHPNITQLVAFVEESAAGPSLIARVEEVLEEHHRASFSLDVSGVPYVIELVRRSLDRDLRVFSAASLLVFGLLIAGIYRSWRIVLGTLCACLGACVSTLVVLALIGSSIGLLTANIITIVFVLTLSHIVFLTANRRAVERELGGEDDGGSEPENIHVIAVRRTFQASIWCSATTLLGFASLLLADAKPLRELGTAGMVGTATALVVAFGIFPLFLAGAPTVNERRSSADGSSAGGPSAGERLLGWGKPVTAMLFLAVILAAPGLRSLDTDPNLLSYFAAGSELREGLERIDRNGGSSPMTIVVSDPEGARLDTNEALQRMTALQETLENDPEVGTALSLPVLLAEAKRAPLAFLLGWSQLLDILESPTYDNVAAGFVTPERTQALYFLRMRESERQDPRAEVVGRLASRPAEHDLRADLVGGLYPLQASLGDLVAGSLLRGLGGLFLLFALIAAVVSRSASTAGSMLVGLVTVPVLVLGTLGWIGAPIDMISSPASNVAVALGIDSMIHLTAAVRRRRRSGDSPAAAWRNALDALWSPILGAALILAGGFGIFVLSSFPPTARFGVAVAAGTLIAACAALLVLPFLAGRVDRRSASAEERAP